MKIKSRGGLALPYGIHSSHGSGRCPTGDKQVLKKLSHRSDRHRSKAECEIDWVMVDLHAWAVELTLHEDEVAFEEMGIEAFEAWEEINGRPRVGCSVVEAGKRRQA